MVENIGKHRRSTASLPACWLSCARSADRPQPLPAPSLWPYSPRNRLQATTAAAKKNIRERQHHDHRARQPSHVHQVVDGSDRRPRALSRDHRPRRSRDLEAEMLLIAAERPQIRQRSRLLRQSRQELEGERARRAGRGRLLPGQPIGPGNRRHQLGEARRHRPDGVGLVDLGQSGAARRHVRSRLPVRELPAADQGVRRRRSQADRRCAAQGRQHPHHRLGL